MEINATKHTSSKIYQEILRIMSTSNPREGCTYQAFINMPDKQMMYQCLKVRSVDINRDYDNHLADEISVVVSVLPGTWTDIILPQLGNLEMILIRDVEGFGINRVVSTYRAYCKTPKDFRKDAPHLQGVSTETINRMDVVEIEFQLIPKLIEKLLPIQAGTIFNNCTMEDALSGMLMRETLLIEGLDDADKLQGVDIVEPDNDNTYTSIPIPHATKLINLPNYMQKESFGIYQQGIGHYIQNAVWYVYPKFAIKRNDENRRYLNVFVSYRDFMRHADNTYRTEGNDVSIIASIDGETNEDQHGKQLTQGNGVRVVNPQVQDTDESLEVKDNKAYAKRSNNVSEFITNPSKSNNDFAPLAKHNQANVNIYEQVSKTQLTLGNVVSVIWQNSAPDLLKPGMIVRIHYIENDMDKMVEGVLMKCHHFIQHASNHMTSNYYTSTSGLFIYVKDR